MESDFIQKRILIKISGESLKVSNNGDIYDYSTIFNLTNQIKQLVKQNYQVAIVMGGGNIFRGKIANKLGLDSQTGDYMGMLATVINAFCLRKLLLKNQVPTEIYTSLPMPSFAKLINYEAINEEIQHKVLIFGCGSGAPNFTTDTTSALRALELNCELILVGKNGVRGVYSADPKIDPDAVFYSRLTYQQILDKDLKVMDLTALTLCKQRNIELRVFDINEKDSILKTLTKQGTYTVIKD